MQLSDVLGYTAATLTTASFVPQVWRTLRTHDVSRHLAEDVQPVHARDRGLAGLRHRAEQTPMLVANSISLVLAAPVLVMRVRFARTQKANPS
jgi:MtN3 and saliva related transmembrane protein